MPQLSVEEILAAVQNETEETEEPESQEAGDDNSVIRGLRAKLKEKNSALKTLGIEVAELREFKTEAVTSVRKNTAKEVFKGLELPEETADLFLKVHEGEVTPDAIRQFVVDYKLPAKLEGAENAPTTAQLSEGFTPGGSSDAAAPGASTVSREEFDKLLYTDPSKAEKLWKEGRVSPTRSGPN